MSDYSTNATVNLNVNGKEAKAALTELKQRASDLQTAIARAAAAGDKIELTKLRKELRSTQKEIKQIESSTLEVAEVMRRMDTAAPKELERTLKTLYKQLNSMERGTESWDKHVNKIQLVEREIDALKKQIKSTHAVMERTLGNLNGASISDLDTVLRMLQADLKQLIPGSRAWDAQKQKIDMVKIALDKATQAANVNGVAIKKALINLDSASIHELEQALTGLEQKLKTMNRNDPAWGKTKRDIEEVKVALDDARMAAGRMHDVMTLDMKNLDKLTPRELTAAIEQLKQKMQNVSPNTKQWEKMRSMMEKLKLAAQTSEATITKTMRHLDTASPERLKTTLDMLQKQLQHLRVGSSAWDIQTQKINRVKAALDRAKVSAQVNDEEVRRVLRNMSAASPKELERTLKALQIQLEQLRRGSKAWEQHVAKIKQVKAELNKVNNELRTQESFWTRLNRKTNEWQATLMGAAATITGLIFAGRSAVNSFASMEEQMANTRKYTGMTVDEVDKLNEAFKNIDTRTGREQLNELAQEAGRLGKNTLEDVQGYVEAADIIRVALVDLGDGATQTIAKISNIFGVEQLMGTKEAMLAVGSTINVLSQNCTASKPYLVEFTQRMAGVGAQADMTIPQIVAFGAVLDANGQKVEMSASAVGKLVMNLFQKPSEVAKQVGLDVNKFTETLQRSTNEGLMMFLERVHQLGDKKGLAVLAPMFKELGLDGVRMSQVLATLAKHLDEVKWQQDEANKAFAQGTSVVREYNIFNNTAQATLDKAKYRLHEMAVELGEKLMPVMKHVYTTSTLVLHILSNMVTFFVEYKREILTVTAAIAAYTLAVQASNIAFKIHYGWVVVCQVAQKAWNAVATTGRVITLACSAAYNNLTGNLTRAAAAQRALNVAMRSNVIGMILALVTLLVGAMIDFASRMKEAAKSQDMLNQIQEEGRKNAQEQIDMINTLREAAQNEALSEQERLRACEKLNAINPAFCAGIDKVTGKYTESKKAVDEYVNALIRQYEIEGAKDKLREIGKQKAELQIKKQKLEDEKKEIEKRIPEEKKKNNEAAKTNMPKGHGRSAVDTDLGYIYGTANQAWDSVPNALQKDIDEVDKQLKKFDNDINTIKRAYGNDIQRDAVNKPNASNIITEGEGLGDYGGGDSDGSGDNSSASQEEKFAKEKEWKEREEALNRIAYAKGQKNYEEYVRRMEQIEVDFNKKKLEHTDLVGNEKVTIEADYYEALKKQSDNNNKRTIEQEDAAYAESLALEKQRYVDGKVELSVYEDACELLELRHLRSMVAITAKMGEEHVKAEKAYLDKMVEVQKKKQKEAEELEKKLQEELKKIEEQRKKVKDEYFGNNEYENKALYDAEIDMLNTVYALEIEKVKNNAAEKLRIDKAYEEAKLAIAKKYNQLRVEDERSSLHKAVDSSVEWLNSDGGKALTGSMDTIVSGMSACFSQLTSIVQAELEIQTAAMEKKYDAQISAAEGNNYKVKQLEQQRAREEAKAKKEANRKMFAMQVIQAVAQTAQGAIAAYASAAAIPITGWIMAPIAAAMAIAAGTLQIAAIKKQQQASEASGYASGGFTPKGRVDEEVGVVHAGEWVASQKLLANPKARGIINALDYAQRTNTIGSLDAADVSRSITAPSFIARSAEENGIAEGLAAQAFAIASYTATMKKLNQRLNEPFVTVNTVTGDTGIMKAQNEYSKLMRNKSPR